MIYKHGSHEIEVFDSVHKLPFLRFQRFNKYQMQSIEIGSSFSDYDQRTGKIIQFLKKGMIPEAIKEMENRRQTVFNAFNEFSPMGKSFAVLVKRIDNVEYKDFTPDDLDRCLKHLTKIEFDFEKSILTLKEVKKKIETELVVYFPKQFPKNGNIEFTALRIVRIDTLLDSIIEHEKPGHEEKIFNAEKELLEHDLPNVWNIWKENNMERTLEVDSRKFGIAVTEMTNQNIEEITTFTFYASVEHLQEKFKKK